MNFQGEINDTRRLLAVEAQEPVGVVRAVNAPGEMTGLHVSLFEKLPVGTEVYAAPPAPVVQPVQVPPELELLKSGLYGCRLDMSIQTPSWAAGYNACRAAMLNAGPDQIQLLQQQIKDLEEKIESMELQSLADSARSDYEEDNS